MAENAFSNSGLAVSQLPPVTASDNGKVLSVASGKWAAVAQSAELPSVSASDNGKVLMVVDGAWAVADLPTDETATE